MAENSFLGHEKYTMNLGHLVLPEKKFKSPTISQKDKRMNLKGLSMAKKWDMSNEKE